MDIFSVFTLCGGLAFFLYGMTVMSKSLEKMAGGKLERMLKRMTSSPFKSLLLGAGITIAIQSSSAMTVMLVGLVNSGVMELRQITDLRQLSPGTFGIPEPPADAPALPADAIDFAVLPCVTCNHLGHRLGHGGGYYDRFLSQYRGGTVLLCREQLIRQEIPVEPHDYPVPWVLTERGLYEDGIPAPLG